MEPPEKDAPSQKEKSKPLSSMIRTDHEIVENFTGIDSLVTQILANVDNMSVESTDYLIFAQRYIDRSIEFAQFLCALDNKSGAIFSNIHLLGTRIEPELVSVYEGMFLLLSPTIPIQQWILGLLATAVAFPPIQRHYYETFQVLEYQDFLIRLTPIGESYETVIDSAMFQPVKLGPGGASFLERTFKCRVDNADKFIPIEFILAHREKFEAEPNLLGDLGEFARVRFYEPQRFAHWAGVHNKSVQGTGFIQIPGIARLAYLKHSNQKHSLTDLTAFEQYAKFVKENDDQKIFGQGYRAQLIIELRRKYMDEEFVKSRKDYIWGKKIGDVYLHVMNRSSNWYTKGQRSTSSECQALEKNILEYWQYCDQEVVMQQTAHQKFAAIRKIAGSLAKRYRHPKHTQVSPSKGKKKSYQPQNSIATRRKGAYSMHRSRIRPYPEK